MAVSARAIARDAVRAVCPSLLHIVLDVDIHGTRRINQAAVLAMFKERIRFYRVFRLGAVPILSAI